MKQDSGAVAPWLSSKPDTFDCADVMLDLCQEQFHNEDDHHDKDYSDDERDNPIQSADIPRRRDSDARSPHDTPILLLQAQNRIISHWALLNDKQIAS
ncbi:hypothetical protein GQ600_15733 [Phytophthora cactorum]|nr:hypothetical protein GQ600_15733 [Phytophthora cactorum]